VGLRWLPTETRNGNFVAANGSVSRRIEFPRKAPLIAQEIDGDLVLFDKPSGSTHRLNSVARVIWRLCDGTREPAAIAAEVAALFGKSGADVSRDVNDVLAQFRDVGLILSTRGAGGETALLLRSVRTAIGTEPPQPIGDLNDVDWNALVHIALLHGVLPLVYESLRNHWREDVPPIVLDRLESQCRVNADVNRDLVRELLELLGLFKTHHIPSVTLRGPVLAMTLYGTLAARQSGDLDIFVPPDAAARAMGLLEARGYELRGRRATDVQAVKAGVPSDITVDLQWALARTVFRFPITLEQIWGRLRPVSVADTTVWQPAPDDEALILCAHASKHCWSALLWIADVARFVRVHQTSLDWRRLLERADRIGAERQLLLGLRLAHDVLGADVPAEALPRMDADSAVNSLAAEIRQRLFVSVEQPTHQGSWGAVRGGLLYVRTREHVTDRIPYTVELLKHPFRCLRELVTPNVHDRAFVRLPESVALLYYIVKPVRLMRDLGVRLMKRRREWIRQRRLLTKVPI
jgi:PqqD family protein of HPr-rel-A system